MIKRFQYASQVYFNLTQEYDITLSISRQGNSYDNNMAENLFSILKTECIYWHKPATFSEANKMIDRYIHFYNHQRIQLKIAQATFMRRLSTENSIFSIHGFVLFAQNVAIQFYFPT